MRKLLAGSLTVAAVALLWVIPAYAQDSEPQPTPDPAIEALEDRIEELEAEVNVLQGEKAQLITRIELNQQEFEVAIQRAEQSIRADIIEPATAIYAPISLAIAVGLVGALWILIKPIIVRTMKRRAIAIVDQAFYKVDALEAPIHIPRSDFSVEKKRLKQLGFKNFQHYDLSDGLPLSGIVIVVATEDDEVTRVGNIIDSQRPKPRVNRMGLIFFTRGENLNALKTFDETYVNYSVANFFNTLAGHIFSTYRLLSRN